MLLEQILVGVIVAGAVVWSVRLVRRSWSGRGRCGEESCGCSAGRKRTARPFPVIEKNAARRGAAERGER